MKPRNYEAKRDKGQDLELLIAKELRRKGIDKEAKRMPGSGSTYRKSDIWCPNIPYSIECKNSEKHNIWKEWEQAESEAKMSEEPILCISGNYRPVLACMKLDTLLNLLQMRKQLFDISKENNEP